MAGYLTPLAFKAAADPAQFPEQLTEGLRTWQAKKLYRGGGGPGGGGGAAGGSSVQIEEGAVDPVLGRSYAEISLEGRSQHKTQEMGTIELRGPAASTVLLVDSQVQGPRPERSIFDGIDVTLPGLAKLAGLPEGSLRAELAAMDAAATKALADYSPLKPEALVPTIAEGLRATRAARAAAKATSASAEAKADADFLLAFKEHDFIEALTRAAGVDVDPIADEETVVQGTSVGVAVRTFLPAGSSVSITSTSVHAPQGWTVTSAPGPAQGGRGAGGGPGGRRETATNEARYRVDVPANAPVTQPYFLEQARVGASYPKWDDAARGLPFAPAILTADVTLQVGGETVTLNRPVMFRFADRVRGELRRDVNIVPALGLGLDSKLLIVPLGTTPVRQRVVVRTTSYSSSTLQGTLRLQLPDGWTSTPVTAPFELKSKGDKTSVTFTVTVPATRRAGAFAISAEATAGGKTFTREIEEVAYPHIQTHRLYWPAAATARVLDLKVAPVAVGYIMGTGDIVADALRRMGVNVTLIDDETLTTGDLSKFDTIVVGVRATEGRPAFIANNGRLLDYMQRGGTLVVQYQQLDYEQRNLPPYPAPSPQNSRVTDETAPVKILAPTHPAFTFPNRITAADFDGWVQERNLYAFNNGFDPRYTALLETVDPGEMPQTGGEVYARVGMGQYVYTSYAWFRQLPAGVPGAYRQLANLISLAKAPRPAR
jgi:hypothetical protein